MCPVSHPFAYLEGSYCCKTNKEKNSAYDGWRCDGSEIEFSSTCCEDNQNTKCEAKPCRNYGKMHV